MKAHWLWLGALAFLCAAKAQETPITHEVRWELFRSMNDAQGARRYFEPLAKAGDAFAQWCMAQTELYDLHLLRQTGSSRAPKRAERWLRLASEQGYAPAQYELADILLNRGWLWTWLSGGHSFGPYFRGNPSTDIKANEDEGLIWMRKAANACDEMALFWVHSFRPREMPPHCPPLKWLQPAAK